MMGYQGSDRWARKKALWQQEQAEADGAFQSGGLFASLGAKPVNRSAHILAQTQSLPSYQPTSPPRQVRWHDQSVGQPYNHSNSISVPSSFLPPINQSNHHAPSTAPSQLQHFSPPCPTYTQHDAYDHPPTQSNHTYMSSLNELKGGPSQSEMAAKRESMLKYQRELAAQMAEKQARSEKEKLDRMRREARQDLEERSFNPYGRGGAGAPMRDATGHVIADHKVAHQAVEQPLHQPINQSFNQPVNQSITHDPAAAKRQAQIEWQRSLAAQVEEKKQREAQNKFRQKQLEHEDEVRHGMGQVVTVRDQVLPPINQPSNQSNNQSFNHGQNQFISDVPLGLISPRSHVPSFASMLPPTNQLINQSINQPRSHHVDRNREYEEMVAEMERLQHEIVADSERIRQQRTSRTMVNPINPSLNQSTHQFNNRRTNELHELIDGDLNDLPDLNHLSHASLLMPLGSTFSQDLSGAGELTGSSEFVSTDDQSFHQSVNQLTDDYSNEEFHTDNSLMHGTDDRRPRRKWNDNG